MPLGSLAGIKTGWPDAYLSAISFLAEVSTCESSPDQSVLVSAMAVYRFTEPLQGAWLASRDAWRRARASPRLAC